MLPFVASTYGLLILSLHGDLRLLFPIVPLLSIMAVWVWIELQRVQGPARWIATAAIVVALSCNAAMSLQRAPHALSVALGLEGRSEYLFRCEPTYRAASVANLMLRPDDLLLSQDPRTFYFDCHVTNQHTLPNPTDDATEKSVDDAIRHLRREGVTHLLLTDANGNASPLDHVADAATPITEYRFCESNGRIRHYRLVSLR